MGARVYGGSPSVYGSGYHTLHSRDNRCLEFTRRCYNVLSKPRDFLSQKIATAYFYPLLTKGKKEELAFGKEVSTKAWKTTEVCPPFKMQSIKACFNDREESFQVTLDNGKVLSYTVRILESKLPNLNVPGECPVYNLVYVAGNHSMKETMLPGIHDYLKQYTTKRNEQEHFSKARMVHITAYDITDEQGNRYFPKSLSEAGLLLKEALCAFKDKYGVIHQIDGHSLGGILVAAALSHLRKTNATDYIPQCIFFNRTPYSIFGASKNEWLGCLPIGTMIFPVAWMLGWSFDVAGEVNQFYLQFRDRIKQMVILDAQLDHRFKGAHLGDDRRVTVLKDNQKFRIIKFKILGTDLNEGTQHGISNRRIFGWNTTEQFSEKELSGARNKMEKDALIERLKFVKAGQSFVDAILDVSLCNRIKSVVEDKRQT
jgi:hypothetical protein